MTNLATVLADVNGATFISINTTTTPKLRGGKSNELQGRVRKVTTGANVMVFQNKNVHGYDAMVKRRLVSEGKDPKGFVLGQRAWGVRLTNTPIVEHNDAYYLEVIFLSPGTTHYEVDGKRVPKNAVEGLPVSTHGAQGGLSDKVIIRTFAIENIDSLTINKKTYNSFTYG